MPRLKCQKLGFNAKHVNKAAHACGICRALINKPNILFTDEPTGTLNSKSAEEIMGQLEDIKKEGTSILLVTHDAKVAARTDRVLFTKDGNSISVFPLQKHN